MIKRIVIVFTLIIATTAVLFFGSQPLSLAASSATAGDTPATAQQLYETGQFPLAAQSYQQLVDQGYADSALYFNLGHAYQAQSDLGRALVNYRRAQELAPRDADIAANLEQVRTQIATQAELPQPESAGLVSNLSETSAGWFTLNEIAVIALAVWVLFVLLVIAFTSSKKGSKARRGLQYTLTATVVALTLSVIGLGSRMMAQHQQPEAVVVVGQVAVAAGPGEQYTTELTLPNGLEVDVLEMRGNWSQLAVPHTEIQGWVPVNAVETVHKQVPINPTELFNR